MFPCSPSALEKPQEEKFIVSAHIVELAFFKVMTKLQTLFSVGARKEKGSQNKTPCKSIITALFCVIQNMRKGKHKHTKHNEGLANSLSFSLITSKTHFIKNHQNKKKSIEREGERERERKRDK